MLRAVMTAPEPLPDPAAELERRLRWRLLPAIAFIALLVVLAALAIGSLAIHPAHPHGLPGDADARTAAATLDSVTVPSAGLRLVASVLHGGAETVDAPSDSVARVRLRAARAVFESIARRHPMESRAHAALGALALAQDDPVRALASFRDACERAPHHAGARLGAGVALAVLASRAATAEDARRLRLEAIAQCAMVDSSEAEYTPALYDRIVLTRAVGRETEARAWTARYLAREASGPWADALRAASR